MVYEQWLKLVEENSVLTREKLKLEDKNAEQKNMQKRKKEKHHKLEYNLKKLTRI